MAELSETAGTSLAKADENGISALKDNPMFRQAAIMVSIAASVALGVAVVLWTQSPSVSPLYGNLAEKDVSVVMDSLNKAGVSFSVDEATGMIMVPTTKVKEIRMQLAAEGLPNSDGMGFELLQQDTGFGTSRMIETARYQQAIQVELARTIATIGAVESARVHLAIPKQSVFVRKRQPASASVVVKLYNGRILTREQIESVIHLVASSVPNLEADKVTVVDQKGRLLSESERDRHLKLSSSQFEYTRQVEDHYRDRIETLLAPIVGKEKIRAQVSADIDFDVTEQTQERYNPDQPALRSEQTSEDLSQDAANQGVPGALSNQPPAAANAPEEAIGEGGEGGPKTINSSKQATRNYELDRVVSHTRRSPVSLRRLSIAVVVDDVAVPGAEGQVSHRQRTPEELERITQLVREAVGFDVRRGDTVKVINSSFLPPEDIGEIPAAPLWEQAWFIDLAKQLMGLVVVILLIFMVIRPTVKRLTATHAELEGADGQAMVTPEGAKIEGPLSAGGGSGEGGDGEAALLLGHDGEPVSLPGGGDYENIMEAARKLVEEDPKRVAQLVKVWLEEDVAA